MRFLILVPAVLLTSAAFAQTPEPAKTAPVPMTLSDARVALFAVANAGSACDNGVQIYCNLLPSRAALAAKLQAAIADLEKPAPPK